MPIEDIVKTYHTPFYLFDEGTLQKRIDYLHQHLTNGELVYAIKANGFLTPYVKVARYEICSYGEFCIAQKSGIPYDHMVISGVNKDEEFLEAIATKNVLRVTIESLHQYDAVIALAKKYQTHYHLLLRLTSGNQFGMSEEDIKDILLRHDQEVTIEGLEYFSGTQKRSLKKIKKEIDYLKNFIEELAYPFTEIEYGPGLPVHYFHEEFDEDSYLDELNSMLSFDLPLYLESGRSIVASCGQYVTSVKDFKTNKEGHFAIIDGGIHQLVYYGGMMGMKNPVYEHLPHREGKEELWTICGSLCTTNDLVVRAMPLRSLEVGDLIVFKNTGAYSITEGIALFLSRDLPAVLLKRKDEIKKLRDHTYTWSLNMEEK